MTSETDSSNRLQIYILIKDPHAIRLMDHENKIVEGQQPLFQSSSHRLIDHMAVSHPEHFCD
jgi:hypothetical protein